MKKLDEIDQAIEENMTMLVDDSAPVTFTGSPGKCGRVSDGEKTFAL